MNDLDGSPTSRSGRSGVSEFAGALLDPDVAIPQNAVGRSGLADSRRFAVYRNNVVVGLIDALAGVFPSLHAIMGEEKFRLVCRNFLLKHPPRSAMMMAYGDEFPQFLETFRPLAKSPFLADVARLERGWIEAFHAADAPVLDPQSLAGIPQAQVGSLRFSAHPATFLLCSKWPVADLFSWRFGKPEKGTDLEKAQQVVVTRPLQNVDVCELTSAQYSFFAALLDGERLDHAIGIAGEGLDLAQTLALALDIGVFSDAACDRSDATGRAGPSKRR